MNSDGEVDHLTGKPPETETYDGDNLLSKITIKFDNELVDGEVD